MCVCTGDHPSSEVPAGPYPLMVQSDDGRLVPVVQAYAFGKYLGYLKVTFDSDGKVVKAIGNPILLNSNITEGECWRKSFYTIPHTVFTVLSYRSLVSFCTIASFLEIHACESQSQ